MFTQGEIVLFCWLAMVTCIIGVIVFCACAAFAHAVMDWVEGRKPRNEFKEYMTSARHMVNVAKGNKAMGYHYAAQAAMQAAKEYRAAAHAHARQAKGV
jgi:formaldehyde-activating enzyme involved in methanogenesis